MSHFFPTLLSGTHTQCSDGPSNIVCLASCNHCVWYDYCQKTAKYLEIRQIKLL